MVKNVAFVSLGYIWPIYIWCYVILDIWCNVLVIWWYFVGLSTLNLHSWQFANVQPSSTSWNFTFSGEIYSQLFVLCQLVPTANLTINFALILAIIITLTIRWTLTSRLEDELTVIPRRFDDGFVAYAQMYERPKLLARFFMPSSHMTLWFFKQFFIISHHCCNLEHL